MTESRHALPYRARIELSAGRVIATEGKYCRISRTFINKSLKISLLRTRTYIWIRTYLFASKVHIYINKYQCKYLHTHIPSLLFVPSFEGILNNMKICMDTFVRRTKVYIYIKIPSKC